MNSTNQSTAQQGRDFYAAFADPAVRRQYRTDARAAYLASLAGQGLEAQLADDVEVKVVFNTRDTFHLAVFRPGDDAAISDAQLRQVQAAGGSTGSVGTLGSSSSFGCVCGTASSAGSAGTIGTAGSA